MHRRRFLAAAGSLTLGIAAGLPASVSRAQASYSAVDLGIPEGFDSVTPIGLNNNGVAVLTAIAGDKTGIFIAQDDAFTQVGNKDAITHATSIADDNTVTGWVEGASDGTSVPTADPVLLTASGQVEMPGERIDGRVFAINQDNLAAGEGAVDQGQAVHKAVIWQDQNVSALKGVPADTASGARDINGRGQVVGWIETVTNGSTKRSAVLLSTDADPVELGTIGGDLSEAVAISEQGQIVGNSTTAAGQTDLTGNGAGAFSWIDGTLTALPTLEGQVWSVAADVNSYSLIAGTIGLDAPATAGPSTIAVVWAPDSLLDLNQNAAPLDGLVLTSAVSINEIGQVLCAAIDAAGASRAVLLTIVGN